MADVIAVLEKLLAENTGPVSIAAGIAAPRVIVVRPRGRPAMADRRLRDEPKSGYMLRSYGSEG
ncbi:hypothetical protein RFM26_21080 [Mesorhizobium sp. VK23B]|uniref:Uncharacterized protein n=1 Tax=Mesorhizobium dulcispinae TaxID=3072316 RepID=A0ABU4XLU8_9HYPH|nr:MULTISPECIES: hypothetical protein [unclassified Mesorhizobium]MDX8468196.1 hypothetical protein [Mesorhizobium sp. VK23B]MDX8474534.1 hypothetical protein [Mesorhizobium sp. VK23A]